MAGARVVLKNGHELHIQGEAVDIAERLHDRSDKAIEPWVVFSLVEGGDVLIWADSVSHIYFLNESRKSVA